MLWRRRIRASRKISTLTTRCESVGSSCHHCPCAAKCWPQRGMGVTTFLAVHWLFHGPVPLLVMQTSLLPAQMRTQMSFIRLKCRLLVGGGQVPVQAWTSAAMCSEIPLHGSGGTVIFAGTFLSDDIPALEEIWQAQTDNEAPAMLITVTPLSGDLIAHLPQGLAHCALARSPIDDWLGFVPDLSVYRSSLWPHWSEYGRILPYCSDISASVFRENSLL